jgi:hypothetical protein
MAVAKKLYIGKRPFMKQPSSQPPKKASRGRPFLEGPPRQPQSFNLTDIELRHLNGCDPSGKGNRSAGLRALIAADIARKAAAMAPTEAVPDPLAQPLIRD